MSRPYYLTVLELVLYFFLSLPYTEIELHVAQFFDRRCGRDETKNGADRMTNRHSFIVLDAFKNQPDTAFFVRCIVLEMKLMSTQRVMPKFPSRFYIMLLSIMLELFSCEIMKDEGKIPVQYQKKFYIIFIPVFH